jgi:hypothetical protein
MPGDEYPPQQHVTDRLGQALGERELVVVEPMQMLAQIVRQSMDKLGGDTKVRWLGRSTKALWLPEPTIFRDVL